MRKAQFSNSKKNAYTKDEVSLPSTSLVFSFQFVLPSKSFWDFEKHTKGISKKLLRNVGYNGHALIRKGKE
jgi:hypothetical protein